MIFIVVISSPENHNYICFEQGTRQPAGITDCKVISSGVTLKEPRQESIKSRPLLLSQIIPEITCLGFMYLAIFVV